MSTSEPLDDERGSAVRFETQCVVIPDPLYHHRSRLPRVVTKSYTLPLWKTTRRSSSAGPALHRDSADQQLVLRLPLPTLSLKAPTSTARSAELAPPPLPPCLVHSQRSPHARHPAHPLRSPQPTSPTRSPVSPDIVTVPLRPCCAACQPVTEAALVSGDTWKEHFSRAASRRRSMSADCARGGGQRTITVAGSAASRAYGALGVSINVDEVDKRRRSGEFGGVTIPAIPRGSDEDEDDDEQIPKVRHPSAAAAASAGSAEAEAPVLPSATACMPPCNGESDERELFPLPTLSPKRTPTPSPASSPIQSISSLMVEQGSLCPSQNASACSGDTQGRRRDRLAPPSSCASSSSFSLVTKPSSEYGSTSDLRLLPTQERQPPSPSVLSALPPLSNRHRSTTTVEEPRPATADQTKKKKKRPSTAEPPRPSSSHSFTRSSAFALALASASSTVAAASVMGSGMAPVPRSLDSLSPRPGSSSGLVTNPSPSHTRLPWRSKRSPSADASASSSSSFSPSSSSSSPPLPQVLRSTPSSPSSPSSPAPLRKKSFLVTSPRLVLADMLRGVGAVAAGMSVPGI